MVLEIEDGDDQMVVPPKGESDAVAVATAEAEEATKWLPTLMNRPEDVEAEARSTDVLRNILVAQFLVVFFIFYLTLFQSFSRSSNNR